MGQQPSTVSPDQRDRAVTVTTIDYDFSKNLHTERGAAEALRLLFATTRPRSLLDVGCGIGTWMAAAHAMGIEEVFGVDAAGPAHRLAGIPEDRVLRCDLTRPWSWGRRFDTVLCLEVAEHLAAEHAAGLVDALVEHSDTIYFSAACPGQGGQHHVHCRWPDWWQGLFNERGYVCSDACRWLIWERSAIEPWYRQNLFLATRAEGRAAGSEPRIPAVLHPDMAKHLFLHDAMAGALPVRWLLRVACSNACAKIARLLRGEGAFRGSGRASSDLP